MSSSSEEGWRQQRQPEASGHCRPAWLCEALAEAAVRKAASPPSGQERNERVLPCTEQDRRGRPAPPTQRPLSSAWGHFPHPGSHLAQAT